MFDKDGATPVVDKDPSTAFPSTVRERRMDLKPHGMSVEQKREGRKMVREMEREKGREKGRTRPDTRNSLMRCGKAKCWERWREYINI